jgi:hypothetical protein
MIIALSVSMQIFASHSFYLSGWHMNPILDFCSVSKEFLEYGLDGISLQLEKGR